MIWAGWLTGVYVARNLDAGFIFAVLLIVALSFAGALIGAGLERLGNER